GAPDGSGVEGEGHVRDVGGVRDSVRRAAEAVRLVQLYVQVIGGSDVPPRIESHQPEVELDAAVLDDAATRRAQVNGMDPAVFLLVVASAAVGGQAHPAVVLGHAAGIGDQDIAIHEDGR